MQTGKASALAVLRPWHRALGITGLYLLAMVALPLSAAPGITITGDRANFADAHYEETNIDLRVKVVGGYVSHQRYLEEGERWRFNPDWADLQLSYAIDADPETDPPLSIRRNRFNYSRAGTTATYVYDERRRIVRTDTGYRWEDRLGNAINYDSNGRIVSYNDRNQVFVHFVRDTEDRIATVEDHHRNTILSYHYNAAGQLEKVSDYSGREVQYVYENERLTQVTDVLGHHWTYTYTHYAGPNRYRLTRRTDPEGNAREIQYTVQSGQVCVQSVGGHWQFDEGEQRWRYTGARCLQQVSQPPLAILSTVRDDEGIIAHYRFHYDDSSKTYVVAEIDGANTLQERTYNKRGEVIEQSRNGRLGDRTAIQGRTHTRTDENGRTTVTEHDEWRNIIKQTYADGASITRKWEPNRSNLLEEIDENGVITRHDYDAKGNRIRSTEAVGLPEQRITEYGYDAFGDRTTIRYIADANTAEAVIAMTYDSYGNLKTRTDAEGHTTEYMAHDVLGNVLEKKDARGHNWKYQYNAAGNLTREETPLGFVTQYGYDTVGNLVEVIDAQEKVTTLGYDARHRLLLITNPLDETVSLAYNGADRPVTLTDALGHSLRMQYDWEGRPTAFMDAEGNTIEMRYGDREGRFQNLLTDIQYPTYQQRFVYDSRQRPTLSEDVAADSVARNTAFAYDPAGNLTELTDANGRVTGYERDAHQRLRRITDALQHLTQLDYDNRDNLTQVTNARNIAIRRYEYDGNDRLVRELMPENAVLEYRHDPNGNLATTIDAKGQVAAYEYDVDNRRIAARYFPDESSAGDSANAVKTVIFSYDALNRLTGYDDGQTSASYQYDDAGRLAQTSVNYGSFSLGYSYNYYANGLKQSFTGPDGITYTYTYTPNGELASVQIPGQGTYTVNEYRWIQPARITLPGGGKRHFEYDDFLRLTQIHGIDPGENPLQEDNYIYDAADNILSRITLRGEYNYGYDELNRLTDIDGPDGENRYDFDPVGNRLWEAASADSETNPHSWTYDDQDRLIQRGHIHYEYDANGSLTRQHNSDTGEETRYQYDLENRLIEVKDGSDNLVASYAYDPFGQRMSKSAGQATIFYLYSEEGLIAEAATAGTVIRTYSYEPGSLWNTRPLFIRQDDKFGYYHIDHLGTPHFITGRNGAVLWSAVYDSFGKAEITIEGIVSNLRFPGQYFDSETGLYYNYLRYYDPALGRYTQHDPIGILGGVNTYTYAYNNPLLYMDPTGEIGLAGAAFGAIIGGISGTVAGLNDPCASLGDILTAGAWGALAGGVSGALPIGGAFSRAIVRGGAAGFTGNSVAQFAMGRDYSLKEAVTQGTIGAISGGYGNSMALSNAIAASKRGATVVNAIKIGDRVGSVGGTAMTAAINIALPEEVGGMSGPLKQNHCGCI